jgi:hypothetical protein
MSIDDVYDVASIGVKYYPNEHYPEVQAQMQNGALLDVPVVWSPAELDISEEGLQESHGTVIGFTPGVTFHLTVQHIPLEGISIEETKTVGVNDIFTIDVTYDPESATNKNITWSSSDENIVSTENAGSLTAKNVGTATITATAADGGYTDTCVVTVIPTQLHSISISGTRSVGSTLTTAMDPAGAAATYQWSRSNTLGGTYQPISGAMSDTYTLTAADAGKISR